MKRALFALLLILPSSAYAKSRKQVRNCEHPSTGLASWYGNHEQGHRMANGKPFDRWKLTCASRWLPLGSKIKVTNAKTGVTATVLVTDRGPWGKSRILDLSEAAARNLGCIKQGVCRVRIEGIKTS